MPDTSPKKEREKPLQAVTIHHRLPKEERIRKRDDFIRIQRSGRKVAAAHCLALFLPACQEWTRLGLTVSKQVGNAVARNRVKRLLREAFRLHKDVVPRGLDVVIIARSSAAQVGLTEIVADLQSIGQRAARLRF